MKWKVLTLFQMGVPDLRRLCELRAAQRYQQCKQNNDHIMIIFQFHC